MTNAEAGRQAAVRAFRDMASGEISAACVARMYVHARGVTAEMGDRAQFSTGFIQEYEDIVRKAREKTAR